MRQYEKGELQYLKLILDKAGAKKVGLFGFGKKKRPGEEDTAGGGGWFGRKKKQEDDED